MISHARSWRLPGPFGDLVLARTVDLRRVDAAQVDAWLRDRGTRDRLVDLCAQLDGAPVAGGLEDAAVKKRLLLAFERGELEIVHTRDVPLAVPDVPGQPPQPAPPPAPEPTVRTYVDVALFDSTGAPVPNEPLLLALPNEPPPGTRGTLDGGGRIRRVDLDAGAVFVAFDKLDARPRDGVPPDVAEFRPVDDDVVLLKRRTNATEPQSVPTRPMPARARYTRAFQLERRNAKVLEFEHFAQHSLVLLPGEPPPSVVLRDGAPRALGLDVLKACLTFARDYPVEQILVTGHGDVLADGRALALRALLVQDRDAWVDLAAGHSRPVDQWLILHWAAQRFRWPCDPGPLPVTESVDPPGTDAWRQFQLGYNSDLGRGMFAGRSEPLPEQGILGPHTWGGVFDCYVRALGTDGDAPVPLYPYGDERTYTGRNAGRIVKRWPFVVLGTEGPGNAPITIAKYGSGSENNYMDLQPLNPQYHIGVDPEFIGQALNVPWEWAPKLKKAGYTVQQDRVDAKPGRPGPPPMPKPGPRAVGCGAHHLLTPFAREPDRRAVQRHAEVLFFDSSVAPLVVECGPGDGACRASVCEVYDPRDFDLDYMAPEEAAGLVFMVQFFDEYGHPAYDAPYELSFAGETRTGVARNSIAYVYDAARPQTCVAKWSRSADARAVEGVHVVPGDYEYAQQLFVEISGAQEDAAKRRLQNLGYGRHDLDEAVRRFQRDCARRETGALADALDELTERHDKRKPPVRNA